MTKLIVPLNSHVLVCKIKCSICFFSPDAFAQLLEAESLKSAQEQFSDLGLDSALSAPEEGRLEDSDSQQSMDVDSFQGVKLQSTPEAAALERGEDGERLAAPGGCHSSQHRSTCCLTVLLHVARPSSLYSPMFIEIYIIYN